MVMIKETRTTLRCPLCDYVIVIPSDKEEEDGYTSKRCPSCNDGESEPYVLDKNKSE